MKKITLKITGEELSDEDDKIDLILIHDLERLPALGLVGGFKAEGNERAMEIISEIEKNLLSLIAERMNPGGEAE